MPADPPETQPAALVAFSIVDALMRQLVRQQTIMPEDAVEMLTGIVSDLRSSSRSGTAEVITLLEKMLKEYRDQTR